MRGSQKNINYQIKWSPEFTYAIGLIATDGCLSKDGRHIIMRSSETEQLENFKKCLEIDNKISETHNNGYAKKPAYRIQLSNTTLYRHLLSIGLMPNKTKIMGSLKIPSIYFFDFLRGCIDGDGCIRRYQDSVYPNSERIYTKLSSSSETFLKWVQFCLNDLLDIKGYLNKGRRTQELTFAKKESLKLLNKIYQNPKAPYLKRKHAIVASLLKK